jgi:apolipoprotein N-acyltransferase
MVVVRPDGLGETYTKQCLVPFGEYIPLCSLLGWVERLSEAAEGGSGAGHRPHHGALSGQPRRPGTTRYAS